MDRPCAAEERLRRLNCFNVSNRAKDFAKNDSGKSSALADNLLKLQKSGFANFRFAN
jgi:hypothetical protein